MRKICSANPDWKIRFVFFFNNHKYSNGPSEMTMVLGFEIAANFGDCTCSINRQQRLVPFHSMPNLRSQNEVIISKLWIETTWCSFLSSSSLQLSSSLLLHRSPLPPLSSPPPPLLLSPPQLFSPPPPLSSSATFLLRSPFLLFSLPFFLLQAPGLRYPVPICHPNFIKDWLAYWHKSVGLMSDQHWPEFRDHCSCIWFGEETSYYTS